MSNQEFWYEEPVLIDSYYLYYKEKQKADDYNQWKQGMYIHNAMSVVMYNAFKKKTDKTETYLKEPLLANAFKTKEQIAKEKEERIKMNLLSNVARLQRAIKEKESENERRRNISRDNSQRNRQRDDRQNNKQDKQADTSK